MCGGDGRSLAVRRTRLWKESGERSPPGSWVAEELGVEIIACCGIVPLWPGCTHRVSEGVG